MRSNRITKRKRVTPYLWGWSVFTFSATVPTHTFGHMRAAGIQFSPFRETVGRAPFGVTGSINRPYLSFASRSTPLPFTSPPITAITAVATSDAFENSPFFFGQLTNVTFGSTSVNVKATKNRLRYDFPLTYLSDGTIATGSVECAVGKL